MLKMLIRTKKQMAFTYVRRLKIKWLLFHMKVQCKRGCIKGYQEKIIPGQNILAMLLDETIITGKLISMHLMEALLLELELVEYIIDDNASHSCIRVTDDIVCCLVKNNMNL